MTALTTASTRSVNLDAMLDAWYIKTGVPQHPNLRGHDILHALLGEGVEWQSEIKVGVIDYVYHALLRDEALNLGSARTFLATVVEAMHMYNQKEAYDFLSDEELSKRITASVKILRQVGIDNI
jgi:hypothetical protein